MPFINSKSLGAPGSSGGTIARAPVCECATWPCFFGLRLGEEVNSERSMRDKTVIKKRDRALIR
jgi:hypothetical protein